MGRFRCQFQLSESTVETEKGRPLSFEADQQMSFMKMKVTGRIEPNNMMTVVKGSVVERQRWPEGALMPEGLRLLEREKGLKKGTAYRAKMFSPSSADVLDVNTIVGDKRKVDLLGRVVELTEVRTKDIDADGREVESVSYVDDNLDVQKSVMPIMGLSVEMVACPKEFATSEPEVFDVIDKMFVKAPSR